MKTLNDLTVDDLIDWVEAQEPETVYTYLDNKACAIAQFLAHSIPDFISFSGSVVNVGKEGVLTETVETPKWLSAADWVACDALPRTFRELGRMLREKRADLIEELMSEVKVAA